MNTISQTPTRSYGWLDSIAIGISIACAVHCLLTPVLLIALPVLATTLWVEHDFHLWLLLLVLPTSITAIFLGCRKHKDRAVMLLSMSGLTLLALVAIGEVVAHTDLTTVATTGDASCPHCAANTDHHPHHGSTTLNLLGGLILSGAHLRNFWLCRQSRCQHQASSDVTV